MNVLQLVVMLVGFAFTIGKFDAKSEAVEAQVKTLNDTVAKDHDVLIRLVTQMELQSVRK